VAFIARAELLRSTNPKEYFLDNHNAIPPCHSSYITDTPSRDRERSLHPRGDDQEASYVLDIFNASRRFRRISRASNGTFNPLPSRPDPSHLVQSQFPRGPWNLFWQAFSRVHSRERETIKGTPPMRFNGAAPIARCFSPIKQIGRRDETVRFVTDAATENVLFSAVRSRGNLLISRFYSVCFKQFVRRFVVHDSW